MNRYEYSSTATVKGFLTSRDVSLSEDEMVVCGEKWIVSDTVLGDTATSPENPLYIKLCTLWIRYEDAPEIPKRCDPYTRLWKFVEEGSVGSIGYHNNRVVSFDTVVGNVFTSRLQPLVIKKLIVTVFVDHVKLSKPICNCVTMKQLISQASRATECELVSTAYNSNDGEINDFDWFILNTSEKRSLYLKKVEAVKVHYSHSHSISEAAKNHRKDIAGRSKSYELYKHWFAMLIYDKFCEQPSNAALQFAQRYNRLMSFGDYQPAILQGYELSASAVFFQALDRFLFADDDQKGCILHQAVLGDNRKNRPDGYMAKLRDGLPSTPVLVSDFKFQPGEIVELESLGYFQSVLNTCGMYFPMLVMASTPTVLSLYLCWPVKNSKWHATIKIFEAKQSQFAAFFCALRFAVDEFDYLKDGGFIVQPTKDIALTESLQLPNVYRCGDTVYKLFDTQTSSRINPTRN